MVSVNTNVSVSFVSCQEMHQFHSALVTECINYKLNQMGNGISFS